MNREQVEQIVKEMFFTGELEIKVDADRIYDNEVQITVSILDGKNNELTYDKTIFKVNE